MKKDIPFWHSFKATGLKKLGFVLSETHSDKTGEVLMFKNSKNYIHPVYLSIDTMSGDFLFCTITTGIQESMPVSHELLAAILDLYSELGLMNGVYNELHRIHLED